MSWQLPARRRFGRGLGFSNEVDGDGEMGFVKENNVLDFMVRRISDEDLGLPICFINTLSLFFVT